MRRYLRILSRSIVFIPFLATCGTEPSGSSAVALELVTAPPVSIMDHGTFVVAPSVRLVDDDGEPVAKGGVTVTLAATPSALSVVGITSVVTNGDGVATFPTLMVHGTVGIYQLSFSTPDLPVLLSPSFVLAAGAPASVRTTYPVNGLAGLPIPSGSASALDLSLNPVPGVTLDLAPIVGGGSAPATVVTGPDGIAPLTGWSLGPVAGANRLQVSVHGVPTAGTALAIVTGLVGPPAKLNLSVNWPAGTIVGATVPVPFSVTVTDTFNNPIAGAPVSFRVISGPLGQGQLPNGGQVTSGSGQATLPSLTLSTAMGTYAFRASVTVGPKTVNADTNLTTLPGPADSVVTIWTPFYDRVGAVRKGTARVVDQYGNYRQFDPVSFAVAVGGGSVLPTVATPDTFHWVEFAWTITTPGPQELLVSAPGVPSDTVHLAGTAVAPADIVVIAGDSQAGVAGSAIPDAIRFRVVDSAGNGVADVPVVLKRDGIAIQLMSTNDTGEIRVAGANFPGLAGAHVYELQSDWLPGVSATVHLTSLLGPPQKVKLVGTKPVITVGDTIATGLRYAITDAQNNPLAGVGVAFTAGHGTLAEDSAATDSLGRATVPIWVIDTVPAKHTLGIMAGGAALTDSFTVLPGPVAALALAGRGGAGFAGEEIGVAPLILATDRFGNPAVGRPFQVAVTGGGGTLLFGGNLDSRLTFDSAGHGRIDGWKLGGVGANSARVTAGTVTLDLSAEAIVPSGFNIEFRNVPARWRPVFREAVFDWRRRITADIPNGRAVVPGGLCAPWQQSIDETIDDLLIFANISGIDGPGGILGGAGPCLVRSNLLPGVGVMQFDVADLAQLEAEGTLDDVILHEMGHVLGIGTLWPDLGILEGAGTADPYNSGTAALAGFATIGGSAYAGNKVPVENTGGQGTRDSHWRESVMPSELMTGYLSAAVNPMSAVTLGALVDIGYPGVQLGTADNYTVFTAPPAAGRGQVGRWIDETIFRPRVVLHPDGKVTLIPTE
jgi:hypothetical protein